MSEPISNDPAVAALLREREGYMRRGLDERVAQVDEQLAARGHVVEAPAAESAPAVDDGPPVRRKPPVKRTAAKSED